MLSFGIYRKYRTVVAFINLVRYSLRRYLVGIDAAIPFLKQTDKYSLRLILKRHGASVGKSCDFETGQTFHNCKTFGNLSVGDNCHIGKNCFFDLRDRVVIGNNVVISMRTTIATHTDMGRSIPSQTYPPSTGAVVIEDGVYIGAGALILQGVTIGMGSVVAAGAVVTKSVGPNEKVAGVPARTVGRDVGKE